MTLNFISACPYCGKHVEPLRIGDTMYCPLCDGVSELVIDMVSDEPRMKKEAFRKLQTTGGLIE